MHITAELIYNGISERGGWNRQQFDLLQIEWPPPKGWRIDILGRHISSEDAQRFVELAGKGKRQPRFRKLKKKATLKEVKNLPSLSSAIIYTDGACHGNPGRGAWAYILSTGNERVEKSMAYKKTTNNRMEILAAIAGLTALDKPHNVTLYSDSQYLVHSVMRGWVEDWASKGFKEGDGKRKNWDLWHQLLPLCSRHNVNFVWVRGHNGNEGNEKCDQMAYKAVHSGPYLDDVVYMKVRSEGGKW